ncbi:hypothetical protein ACIA5D_01725 [Actinoplanes sp. NPDC051513]|uniref:hypothetical protein n=1 Tax=Actinoplanes sp. NPDC051513 TaxID=3363908 RepID=UPI003797D513
MTTTTTRTEHLHDRPAWDCRICKQPWPCANARNTLLDEFRSFPSVLTIYLSTKMYDAMGDLGPDVDSSPDFYERFLSWANTDY